MLTQRRSIETKSDKAEARRAAKLKGKAARRKGAQRDLSALQMHGNAGRNASRRKA